MRKNRRIFGNNLKLFLSQKEIEIEDFAKVVNCTEYELCKIIDARLILDTAEEKVIADALDKSLEDMYVERTSDEYEKAGCIECRGTFEYSENKKLVLDLLDIYCDIQEILADEVM